MRILEIIGQVLTWVVAACLVVLVVIGDIWVLLHWGVLAWLFVAPLILAAVWLVFSVVVVALGALASSITGLFMRALGRPDDR